MTEVERIVDQLKRGFEGPAWCGQSVAEAVQGLSVEQVFAHPISGAHSIAELVLHVAAWESIIRRSILGEGDITVAEDVNFPPIGEQSERAWNAIVKEVTDGHLELRRVVAELDSTRLDEVPVGATSTVYVLLHGVVQHDLYHAAQIMLLRK